MSRSAQPHFPICWSPRSSSYFNRDGCTRLSHHDMATRNRGRSSLLGFLRPRLEVSVKLVTFVRREMGEALARDFAHQRVLELAATRRHALGHQRLELGAGIAAGDDQVRSVAGMTLELGTMAFGAGHRRDVAADPIVRP